MTRKTGKRLVRRASVLVITLALAGTSIVTAAHKSERQTTPQVIYGFVDQINHDQHGRPVAEIILDDNSHVFMLAPMHLPETMEEGSRIVMTVKAKGEK